METDRTSTPTATETVSVAQLTHVTVPSGQGQVVVSLTTAIDVQSLNEPLKKMWEYALGSLAQEHTRGFRSLVRDLTQGYAAIFRTFEQSSLQIIKDIRTLIREKLRVLKKENLTRELQEATEREHQRALDELRKEFHEAGQREAALTERVGQLQKDLNEQKQKMRLHTIGMNGDEDRAVEKQHEYHTWIVGVVLAALIIGEVFLGAPIFAFASEVVTGFLTSLLVVALIGIGCWLGGANFCKIGHYQDAVKACRRRYSTSTAEERVFDLKNSTRTYYFVGMIMFAATSLVVLGSRIMIITAGGERFEGGVAGLFATVLLICGGAITFIVEALAGSKYEKEYREEFFVLQEKLNRLQNELTEATGARAGEDPGAAKQRKLEREHGARVQEIKESFASAVRKTIEDMRQRFESLGFLIQRYNDLIQEADRAWDWCGGSLIDTATDLGDRLVVTHRFSSDIVKEVSKQEILERFRREAHPAYADEAFDAGLHNPVLAMDFPTPLQIAADFDTLLQQVQKEDAAERQAAKQRALAEKQAAEQRVAAERRAAEEHLRQEEQARKQREEEERRAQDTAFGRKPVDLGQ